MQSQYKIALYPDFVAHTYPFFVRATIDSISGPAISLAEKQPSANFVNGQTGFDVRKTEIL